MKVPDLCAQCGHNPPSFHKDIKDSVITWFSLLKLILGVGATITTISYTVPLCSACYRRRQINSRVSKMIFVLGLVMIGVSFASLLGKGPVINIPLLAPLLTQFGVRPKEITFFVLIVVGTLAVCGGLFMGLNKLSSTDGKTLRFYNKDYQKAFAELNPHFVKTKTPRY